MQRRVSSLRLLALLPLLAGGCVYAPHSFSDQYTPFPGTHVDLGGCLDVAISPAADEMATGHVVEYSFGNRCMEQVGLDLAGVRAVEVGIDGVRRPLRAYDPRRELTALPIEGRWRGHERIEYLAAGARDLDMFADVCVEVGGLDRSAPARGERWVCTSGQERAL